MNYRHDFHAGNFADVFKHIFLTRALLYLGGKPAAFRYLETHAGSGLYDLSGPEAERTSEWRGGIGRLAAMQPPPEGGELIAPYLAVALPLLEALKPRYPGSPAIARALLRPSDRIIFCELHPQARQALRGFLGKDRRAKLIEIDGYAGLKAFLPPVERRGLILIDPPFEDVGEFDRLAGALESGWRKWADGVYMVWYPVKDHSQVEAFARRLKESGIRSMLRLELQIDAAASRRSLTRCGLIIINPPFRLEAEAKIILPWLSRCLAIGEGGHVADWLAGE